MKFNPTVILFGFFILMLIIGFSALLFGFYLYETAINEVEQTCEQQVECEVYSCEVREYLKKDLRSPAINADEDYQLCIRHGVTQ